MTVLKITKPKLAVNEECEDLLSFDDELNEVVMWGMSRLLLGAMDEERLELIVDRKLMLMVTNKVGGNGRKEHLRNEGHG